MAALNKVLLIGNLTREPELRYTPGGAAVCEFGLAMNRKFSANGQDREETCFVDIVVWGKQAESCNRYLEKGAPAFIEGRLNYEQWQDRDTNAKRSRLRVVAERVQFLGSRGGGGGDKGGDGGQSYGGNDYQDDQYDDNGSGYDSQPQGGSQPRGGNQSYGRQPAPSRPAPAQNYPQEQYRPQPPQSQPAPTRQAPPPPPPPMPQGSFDVEDAEDDIPF